jgi:hypothetical protein
VNSYAISLTQVRILHNNRINDRQNSVSFLEQWMRQRAILGGVYMKIVNFQSANGDHQDGSVPDHCRLACGETISEIGNIDLSICF